MSDDKCVSEPMGGRKGGWGQDERVTGTRSKGGATGLSSSASALLLCCSSEVQDLDFQGEYLWGEEGVPGWVPPVLDHPLALGARQVVFLPPQCIGVKPEGQTIV